MSTDATGYTITNPPLTSAWRRAHPSPRRVEYRPEFVQRVLVRGCCGKKGKG